MEKENNLFPETRLSNCLLELEQCTNHASCARSLNRLRALCTPRSCDKLRYQCLLAHRDYQKYGSHDNCTCDTEADFVRKQRCLDYQLSILDNKCVDECRSALKTVDYGRPNLKHCTCDGQSSRSIEDLSRCNLLRRNLISHPCMQNPPLLYRDIQKTNQTAASSADLYALLQSGLMDTVNLNPQPSVKDGTNDVHNAANHSVTEMKPEVDKPERLQVDRNSGAKVINESSSARLTLSKQIPTNIRRMEKENNLFPETRLSNCLLELEQCTNHASCARSLNRLRALCTPRSCDKLR
ncbi:hypothetical protein AHF37_09229 [Paragonimus kellicotti]|nr:hypothetical protein AHF37_09229 [Paragonimus kellicotti]